MNREIKFRAFDKSDSVMYHTINFEDMCKMTIMQFTGFEDKNGKEIYEGDIIYFKANYSSKRNGWIKGIFIYEEDNYFKPSIKVGYDYYQIGEETDEFPYTSEVVGNIYQNADMLISEK